ncbi:hypothetical protein SAMN05216582_102146 [Selenomonas ruminantium]|uniref:Uncharacterized protein n=1 Tax=Selenomonas ruminantium TaxID=971 RepID=A0A1M6RMD2_SELRU|nr:hypothetical protein [Selenomonas ruminantium]SHK33507.1 hypothetical protein SAMN05216582_102146 [Selenomonas ruminantium]
MEVVLLLGAGLFLGWLIFSPKQREKAVKTHYPADANEQVMTRDVGSKTPPYGKDRFITQQHEQRNRHTLRNVAGGMVAGAVLGHMLSGDKAVSAHEVNNTYNTYNELHDYNDDYDGYDYDDDESEYEETLDRDYDSSDYDYDDDYSDDYGIDSHDDYDSGSAWESDSYDDGGDW